MDLQRLTRKEKGAILKTLITIAGADNHLSYSENIFLNMFLMKINEDNTFLDYLNYISPNETIQLIRNLNYSNKQDLVYLWIQMASKASGDYSGVFCVNDFPNEKNRILELARLCDINIDIYKKYTVY